MVIFDCNGVLVDSEPLVAAVAAEEFTRVGFAVTPEIISRYFTGRRAVDMCADMETASGRKLPPNFRPTLSAAILERFRTDLRPVPHAAYALTWLRGPRCVASSSTRDRIRFSLETTDLLRFFDPALFSGVAVPRAKPAPDLFLHAAVRMGVAPADCIVVEDSAVGIAGAVAAGMRAIGFAGQAAPDLPAELIAAGAHAVITDLRALKATVADLRGW